LNHASQIQRKEIIVVEKSHDRGVVDLMG